MMFFAEVQEALEGQEASHREIFTCKRCKHSWAHDYVVVSGVPYRIAEHHYCTPELDAQHCPRCHARLVKHGMVQGKLAHKPCNEQCQGASSLICHCSCNGKNHGKHLIEVV